jgi:hypothetical protein
VPHSSKAAYGGMAHSAAELMVILTNLAPVGRRGEPCTRTGAASRWLCGNSPFGRHPYADLRAQLMGGHRMHSSGRGDVSSS